MNGAHTWIGLGSKSARLGQGMLFSHTVLVAYTKHVHHVVKNGQPKNGQPKNGIMWSRTANQSWRLKELLMRAAAIALQLHVGIVIQYRVKLAGNYAHTPHLTYYHFDSNSGWLDATSVPH